jgi:hypothetical protein
MGKLWEYRRFSMNRIARWTALTLITLLATAAFAADAAAATKLSLTLTEATTIAGTKLAPGEYTVLVNRDGDSAKVRVNSGSKELVNTTAKFREMSQFVGGTVLARTPAREVVELQSKKLKGALVFNVDAAPIAGQSK